ncbi:imm11 family protein [Hymenobacter terricola]|uniref:imm11 family protein n=1 Tax=Hymenobacter terricola TaxID=2819236 RepID=UPI001B3038B3|nr:DUF1629 domain-containing protein [Hymenobacter terricola]
MAHFSLSPQDSRHAAVACAPENILPYFTIMAEIINQNKIPFDLTLKKVSFGKSGSVESPNLSGLKHQWFDYLPNTFAWPVMSERLREIIDYHASGDEQYEWIRVNINSETSGFRRYFMLRFKKQNDVLDLEKSVFHKLINKPKFLVNPAFSQEKIANLCVFGRPDDMFWQIPSGIYVSRQVWEDARRKGLAGLHFENARIF